MSNNKWGVLSLFMASVAIVSGGIAIFFSITLALSLNKFFQTSTANME